MTQIRVLPQQIANQIAAGEVVERPASVVKELVENAIDAGAGKIAVEVEIGGRRLIKITDDGHGIGSQDVKLAFVRHATSKLNVFNDLELIETLGFRGEALASIASVARVSLITKTNEEEIATSLISTVEGEFQITETVRPPGTTVEVRDLFFNTPARRKFLKSQPTENFHITAIVTHYALANPSIAFSLTNNGRESLRVAKAVTLRERAYQLFGKDMIESLIPVSGENPGFVRVTGFVSAPRERRTSRDSQYIFVNGRFVKDRVVSKGISEAYRSVLPHGVYPVAFLFLEMPPAEVDVNVHPSKTEVRFRRSAAVRELVTSSVRTALSGAGIGKPASTTSTIEPTEDFSSEKAESGSEQGLSITRAAGASGTAGEVALEFGDFEYVVENTRPAVDGEGGQRAPATPETGSSGTESYPELPPVDSAYSIPSEVGTADLDSAKIRTIGQLHNSFIIATDDKGLLLIDQHVAHERILFDYFRGRASDVPIESQNLLIPELIDLTPAQAEAISELGVHLEVFGFDFSVLSGRSLAIKSAPSDLPAGEIKNLVSEILETIEGDNVGRSAELIRDDIAASLACKAAVKINTTLTREKMNWMIENLLSTSSPSSCPHGRPVVLRLTMKDIERRFHRT